MTFQGTRIVLAGLLGLFTLSAGVGCADNDRPTSYGKERPPVDQLDSRDKGLQSADVLQASDKIAMSLLSTPELRDSSKQWTLVVDKVEDKTRDRKFTGVDYDIFLQRLRANISKQGRGQVRLIENRQKFYEIRDRELENTGGAAPDEFGQGEGGRPGQPAAPKAISPDFGIYMVASDLPNRGTTYYLLNFRVVNLKTREEVFGDFYEVKVAR